MGELTIPPKLSQEVGKLHGALVLENPGQGELFGGPGFDEIERPTIRREQHRPIEPRSRPEGFPAATGLDIVLRQFGKAFEDAGIHTPLFIHP